MENLLADTAFLKRFFAPEEQAYILSRGAFSASSMAGCFAAKEAFVKALGLGFDGIQLSDVVILHQKNGAPYLALRGTALAAFQKAGATKSHVSIAHDGGLAIAFVVLETA